MSDQLHSLKAKKAELQHKAISITPLHRFLLYFPRTTILKKTVNCSVSVMKYL